MVRIIYYFDLEEIFPEQAETEEELDGDVLYGTIDTGEERFSWEEMSYNRLEN